MAQWRSARSRELAAVGTVLLAAGAALLVAMLATNWLVVEVHTAGRRSNHLVVPIPMNLARVALHAIPAHAIQVALPHELRVHRERALQVLREVQASPEGVRIPIEDTRGRVTFSRRGDLLLLRAEAENTVAEASVPFNLVSETLESFRGESFNPRVALDLLAGAGRGRVLSLDSCRAHVVVSVW